MIESLLQDVLPQIPLIMEINSMLNETHSHQTKRVAGTSTRSLILSQCFNQFPYYIGLSSPAVTDKGQLTHMPLPYS